MSETATRTTAPRGRGRGRGGRGGSSFAGGANSRNASHNGAVVSSQDGLDNDEDEELKELRQKYGGKNQLGTVQSIFPDWSEMDILSTLKDANGDTELAINRITEGQAQQWGSVKTKKTRQPSQQPRATSDAPQTTVNGRGSFSGRGRGAGERGARGGGRGRGGAASSRGGGPIKSLVNGVTSVFSSGKDNKDNDAGWDAPSSSDPVAASSSHLDANKQATDAASTTATVGNESEAPLSVTGTPVPSQQAAVASNGPWQGWGNQNKARSAAVPQNASAPSKAAAAASSPWGQVDQGSAPSTTTAALTNAPQVKGSSAANTSVDKALEKLPEPVKPVAASSSANLSSSTSKPAPKRPTQGSTMSWAQIARPQEPPKPVAAAAVEKPAAPQQPHAEPQMAVQPEDEEEYTQAFEPQTVSSANHDPWASTPAAASVNPVTADTLQPLGVGEGWADSVLAGNTGHGEVANNQQAYHHAAGSPDVQSALPQQGQDPAGPIEVDEHAKGVQQAPASLEQPLQAYNVPVAANLEAQVEQQDQQQQAMYSNTYRGDNQDASQAPPPGFGGAKAPSPSTHTKSAQSGADRVGVQFGSLGLFDPAQNQQAGQQSQGAMQSGTQTTATQTTPYDSQDRFTYPTQQTQQQQQPHMHPQMSNAYNQQYASQYGHQVAPTTQQQQQDFSSAYLQHFQQQQQAARQGHDQSSASSANANGMPPPISPYASLSDQQHGSYYGQSPAPTGQQTQPQAYAGYGSAQQQQHQQDYASLYGAQHAQPQHQQLPPQTQHHHQQQNDPLRSLYGYTGYDQYQQQNAAYGAQRTGSAQADDSTKQQIQPQQSGVNTMSAPQQQQGMQAAYAAYPGYSQYPYYGYPGYPSSQSPYQQAASPYAQYQQYAAASRPPYQQTQSGMQYRTSSGYGQPQPGYYQQRSYGQGAMPQQQAHQHSQQGSNDRDTSSYKNFGDF